MGHAEALPAAATPGGLGFARSRPLTLGVELELGIIDPLTRDLVPAAPALLGSLAHAGLGGRFKPELTDAMIEVNSTVHADVGSLGAELESLVQAAAGHARGLQLRLIGGGTHPFQDWPDRRISQQARFQGISQAYGYLAKQFTVFGQHVHVGCGSGDDAIYLMHALTRHAPLLLALSAASPYWRSVDTSFACCRANIVNAFPLSGPPPAVRTWTEFEHFHARMCSLRVAQSIKDYYWDVRVQPQFGTVEVRVFDTPLRVQQAIDNAALVQALAAHLLDSERHWPADFSDVILARNRFQASRHGLIGEFIDPARDRASHVQAVLLLLLDRLGPRFRALGSSASLERLRQRVTAAQTDSEWLRHRYARSGDFRQLVLEISEALEGR